MAKEKLDAQRTTKKAKGKYTRYTRAHLKRRNIRFWLCWLVLVVLIVLGLMRVHSYFAEQLELYEESHWNHTAEEAFKVFSERRFDVLYRFETMTDPNLEGEEEYIKYLNSVVGDNEISYTEVAPKKPNEKRYLVTVNDKAFAEFSLKRDESKPFKFFVIPITSSYPWGHETYTFDVNDPDFITIDSKNPLEYDYYVPSYASIIVNGRELDDSYYTGEETKQFFEGHLPKDVNGFTVKHYTFTCALGEPEVSVLDSNGYQVPLKDEGEGIYRYEYVYDDEDLKPRYEATAMEFVKTYCLFSSGNKNKNDVTALCVKGSKAVNFINNYEKTWITKADKQSYANESSCNYTFIDGKVLCCDVSLNYITVTKGKTNDYPMNMRLYLYKQDDVWKIYDFDLGISSSSES